MLYSGREIQGKVHDPTPSQARTDDVHNKPHALDARGVLHVTAASGL